MHTPVFATTLIIHYELRKTGDRYCYQYLRTWFDALHDYTGIHTGGGGGGWISTFKAQISPLPPKKI